MNILLSIVAGSGVLLIVSPWVWPRRAAARTARRTPLDAGRERLVQAGLGSVPVGVFIAASAVLGLGGASVAFAMTGVLALGVVIGAIAAAAPAAAVGWRARVRRNASRTAWPDVVDQLVSAVRSGLSLPDSIATLATAGPVGLRAAFAEFAADYRRTASFGLSIDRLKERLADPVADRILETLRMAREVGGTELVAVLRNLSAYLRQEAAIRSEVEARQSWVRNAAKLGVAAPWVVLLLLGTRPEAAVAYNAPVGSTLIVAGLAVSVVAYRIMVGIGRLPEERRWFA